jgi:precorrin-2/cobalt-factor-2 C20-methyltransferase
MSAHGKFTGIGVGPGEAALITMAGLKALREAHIIFAPKATSAAESAALSCIRDFEIPAERFREVAFKMDPDRGVLRKHYAGLAREIGQEINAGKNVAYLTIGDTLTYSTYGYALAALLEFMPEVEHRTIPGVTSYAATAAATGWPLGEGKERMLILPCPDEMGALRKDIETHDIVVLMKIGERLPAVLDLIRDIGIEEQCAFGAHVGQSDQKIFSSLSTLHAETSLGYLSTMLIRKLPREKRHT